MILIEGLEEIASDYGGMLIDQFGVLHDGTRLYSGSLDVLARLRALKIPIAVMTNSGKRTEANIARLTKMGIPREFYVDAVSSGEVAYEPEPLDKPADGNLLVCCSQPVGDVVIDL